MFGAVMGCEGMTAGKEPRRALYRSGSCVLGSSISGGRMWGATSTGAPEGSGHAEGREGGRRGGEQESLK